MFIQGKGQLKRLDAESSSKCKMELVVTLLLLNLESHIIEQKTVLQLKKKKKKSAEHFY